jgi:hypothetical protein
MPIPEIEEFAKLLVQHVRDVAIQNCDRQLRPDVHHIIARRWKEAAQRKEPEHFAETIIPDIVDETMFCFLHALDEGVLQMSLKSSDGRVVDLTEEGLGELAGWYAGRGWREAYAQERFANNFPNLGKDPEK